MLGVEKLTFANSWEGHAERMLGEKLHMASHRIFLRSNVSCSSSILLAELKGYEEHLLSIFDVCNQKRVVGNRPLTRSSAGSLLIKNSTIIAHIPRQTCTDAF